MKEDENKLTIDWTDLSMEPKWYDFFTGEVVPEPAKDAFGAYLLIAPYPAEMAGVVIRQDGTMEFTGSQQKKIFDHCFKDFRGNKIVDANGQKLVFSEDIKDKIFDYNLGNIKNFVIIKSREYEDKKGASLKN